MTNSSVNKSPSSLSIADFTYDLPDEKIAKYPLKERDLSKLLVYRNGQIEERTFRELPTELQSNDCLVFNDTKVVHARMRFQKPTGAQIEILCLDPIEPMEVSETFASKKISTWKAMIGNAKRWKDGETLTKKINGTKGQYLLHVRKLEKNEDAFSVQFFWEGDISFAEVLDEAGTMPLPPYLNRETEAEDEERYQTVYAQADGSVAAPTAGLHFTKRVFDDLNNLKVNPLLVTLHVGAGTFKPVKSATMQDHEMHQERILVSRNTIEKMLSAAKRNRIIAIGTTSLRTIESIYWFGVKLSSGMDMKTFFVGQWEPYTLSKQTVLVTDALNAVIDWLDSNKLPLLSGYTQLMIAPGYRIRMADALITNFHQPQSTLLLLVSAMIGDDWRRVYNYALNNEFRFLSFGDSSILFRQSEVS
jgi:S-adenosylmethionine:tRNA ribosyltransferase-isomerase